MKKFLVLYRMDMPAGSTDSSLADMEAAVRNAGRRFFFLRARRKQRVAPGSGSLKLKTTIAI